MGTVARAQRTRDDNVCVRHQPRQIPIFSSLVSSPSSSPSPFLLLLCLLSSSILLPREGNGHCGANEALLQGQCDPRSPQLGFHSDDLMTRSRQCRCGPHPSLGHSRPSSCVLLFSVGRPHSKLRSVQSFFPFPNLVATLK